MIIILQAVRESPGTKWASSGCYPAGEAIIRPASTGCRLLRTSAVDWQRGSGLLESDWCRSQNIGSPQESGAFWCFRCLQRSYLQPVLSASSIKNRFSSVDLRRASLQYSNAAVNPLDGSWLRDILQASNQKKVSCNMICIRCKFTTYNMICFSKNTRRRC